MYISSYGGTVETLYNEIESELRGCCFKASTREEFLKDLYENDDWDDQFNFQAIYNIAEDEIFMRKFINKHTGSSGNQKTNSSEIERILKDWLKGKFATDEVYSIYRCRVMQLRQRYYRFCLRLAKTRICYADYHDFSKWVKSINKNKNK